MEQSRHSQGGLINYTHCLIGTHSAQMRTIKTLFCKTLGTLNILILGLGGGGVQGHGKGQRLIGIKVVNGFIGLVTYQSKIYEK